MKCPFCSSEMQLSNFSIYREWACNQVPHRPMLSNIILESHPYLRGAVSLERYQCNSCSQWMDRVKTDLHPNYIYILPEYHEHENTH